MEHATSTSPQEFGEFVGQHIMDPTPFVFWIITYCSQRMLDTVMPLFGASACVVHEPHRRTTYRFSRVHDRYLAMEASA